MPASNDSRAPAGAPTPYAELNAVLAHLVEGARTALGGNFVGAYLQGSFAVGDFTEFSDCDFVVVTARELSAEQLEALQTLHAAIHQLPYVYWRTGLEGSYAPAAVLRRLEGAPRDPPDEPRGPDWKDPGRSGAPAEHYPFWYLDHGSNRLARSEHDNTEVVRWCLREKGVTLAGPPPRELIDPVSASALRAEVRKTLDLVLALNLEPMAQVAWQAFWVGLVCRMLHTLATGVVSSKKAAMAWAAGALDPKWRSLIERAAAVPKGDPTQSGAPADPAEVTATREFARYAQAHADQQMRAREILERRMAEKRGHGGGFQAGRPLGGPNGGGRAGGQFTPPPMKPGGRRGRG